MGKVSLFEILYDNPQGVYCSGGTLSGKVVLNLNEGLRLKGVYIHVTGLAQVHWTESRKTHHNRRTHTHTDHYSNQEVYFNIVISLLSKDPQNSNSKLHLAAGNYVFPFSTSLPHNVPNSFEGVIGFVRYYCKAVVDRPWRFNFVTKKPFSLINHFDLNLQPLAANNASNQNQKTLCCMCCESGPISARANIPRIGYVPGECILVTANVTNFSNRQLSGTKLVLYQFLTFHATTKSKVERRVVSEACKGPVPEGGQDMWNDFPLPIPPVPASELVGCKIIDISYQLDFVVVPSGFAFDLDVHLPIVIGTIPLRSFIPPSVFSPTINHDLPPPSYNESIFGSANIQDDSDNQFTMGQLSYTPLYPTYKFT